MSQRIEPPAKPPRGSLEWLGNAALFERLRAEQLTHAYAAEDRGDAAMAAACRESAAEWERRRDAAQAFESRRRLNRAVHRRRYF